MLVSRNNMKEESKFSYEAPAVTVVCVQQEGVICNSNIKGGNSINNWENGDTTEDVIYM